MEIINIVLALATIAFGALALCWPRWAMGALSLATTNDKTDGMSELRAASGGAFVATGSAAILLSAYSPFAWIMLGMHYAGAGLGRITSIIVDGSGSRKIWGFFAIEIVFAAWLIAANWPS